MAALIDVLVHYLRSGRGGGGGGGRSGGPKKDPNESYWNNQFTNENALGKQGNEAMKSITAFNNSVGSDPFNFGTEVVGKRYTDGRTSRYSK
jgi:hypothetical protein